VIRQARLNVVPDAMAVSLQPVVSRDGHDKPENAALVMALNSSNFACARLIALVCK
jgi:hypothetical protein